MNANISDRWEPFIRSQVQSGRYESAAAVVDEAMRLLEEQIEQDKLIELQREIAVGVEQADRGELAPFDPHATLGRIRSRQANSPEQS